ncbi:3-deoxy-D-manno-octulosonic acid transferase [Winogradskyella litorisediminis]|uniref:3-deoxy-D-manno-octulosonic acid transferase n=1 Tax=Winogradskyella litorisediminis TaxID=1156618 RepID=A0ABW3N3H0_9FLAO
MILKFFYTIGIYLLSLVLQVFSVFNKKIKLGVIGRKNTFEILKNFNLESNKTIWMHCASLGEYEQGLPVIQEFKKIYPNYKVVVSFFSPSGYENKKNSKYADCVVYLPLDTPSNARKFLNAVEPKIIIFVKYEIWPNILLEAEKRKIKAYLISATFRENQIYFKWYGSFMRKALFTFNHIFTQDRNSELLLKNKGYKNTSVAGDTRFDRVSKQLDLDNSIDFIESFKNQKKIIVFGSSWPADDTLFIPFINNDAYDIKYIIAPHNIKSGYVDSITEQLKVSCVRYSEMEGKNLSDYKVLILDTIGYLNRTYSYANIAYVGGAAGTTGLHNILEAAVFGVPIIIGKNYNKFPEAIKLIRLGGVVSVKSAVEFEATLTELLNNRLLQVSQGEINKNFIENNKYATDKILKQISI